MHPLLNSAERPLAEAIRLLQVRGFEQALWQALQRVAAPDNLAILIYRHSGPAEVFFTQSDDLRVFAQLRSTYTDPSLFTERALLACLCAGQGWSGALLRVWGGVEGRLRGH